MNIIFIQAFSSATETFMPKDEGDFDDLSAINLIDGGIAKPKVKKEYTGLKAKIATLKRKEDEQKVKAFAILKQDELKKSATQLAEELVSTLELIDDDEFKKLLLIDGFGIVSGTEETAK